MKKPWCRLYAEFAFDPKIQCMEETFQRRFIMLLCLKCNDDLNKLDEKELAFALKISEKELHKTKEIFLFKKFIDDKWNLLKWDKRQYVSDLSTERVRKHRSNKKKRSETVSETPPDTDTDTDTDTDIDTDIDTDTDKRRRKRIPKNYPLNKKHIQYARNKGIEDKYISEIFEDFKIYHRKEGKKFVSWYAAWQTWVRNHLKFEKRDKQNNPSYKYSNDLLKEIGKLKNGKD